MTRAAFTTALSAAVPQVNHASVSTISDDDLQDQLLQGVSRTFALTIPQLPPPLRKVVGNAYLLCRIVDTIEDEPNLTAHEKRRFCTAFAAVVAGQAAPESLSVTLAGKLSPSTPEAERWLIAEMPRVIAITHSLDEVQRDALSTCVHVMADGMAAFQEARTGGGLANLAELDLYCYYVAGDVGEMLTRLFCNYSQDVARNREALMRLAVSFGQGLQMTNILKDMWEDRQRGACWLPQDVFREHGFDLAQLAPDAYCEGFRQALERLVRITHGHLRDALQYTLLIPKHETEIRQFCLWAIGMAVLTLRKIARNPRFRSGSEVKISRRSVKLVILASRLWGGNNTMLKLLFAIAGTGLPRIAHKRDGAIMPASLAAR